MSNSTGVVTPTLTTTLSQSTVTVTSSTPVVTTSDSSTFTSAVPTTSTSVVSVSPSSTVIIQSTITPTSVPVTSQTVVITPSSDGSVGSPTIVTITSTQAPVTVTPSNTTPVSSASSSATATFLGTSSSSNNGSSGLSTSGRIAIAVVIPIIAIAALFLLGLFFWRKRKARKTAEEQRKDEMAEYGFNPNNDPTLVPVGAAYTDGGSEGDEGYRGWGTTSSNPRKPSTTLGSNGKPQNGMAYSDTTSQPGNYGYQGSANGQPSEPWSGDTMVHGHPENIDGVAALGGAAALGGGTAAMSSYNNRTNQSGVQRGPSNASSTYSHNLAHSETSSDSPANIANYYQEEVPYNIYNDVAPAHGPYGDGSYNAPGSDQPVIRDVQARRNTRIERVPTFPQTQGGIAQNF